MHNTANSFKSNTHHCIENIIYLQTYDPMVCLIPEQLVRLNNQIHLLSNILAFQHHVNVQQILCIHNNRKIKIKIEFSLRDTKSEMLKLNFKHT